VTAVILAALVLIFYRQAPLSPMDLIRHLVHSGRASYESTATEASVNRIRGGPVKAPATEGSQKAFEEFLREMDVRSARNLALASVLDAWGVDGQIDPPLDLLDDDLEYFQTASARRGLSLLQLRCGSSMLETLGLPAVVTVRLPDVSQSGFLAVHRLENDRATVSRARQGQTITISTALLQSRCDGAIYIPWKDYIGPPEVIPRNGSHGSVAVLKSHLRQCGFSNLDGDAFFDEATLQAVKILQRNFGLRPDGIVGPLTKIVLYNENPQLEIPRVRGTEPVTSELQGSLKVPGNNQEPLP